MSPRDVLAEYERRINLHDFDLMEPLISHDAIFWFGDGSHIGIKAIRTAFERTWKSLANDTYWLEDLAWVASGDDCAACTYRFNWKSERNGREISGSGRGTSVLRHMDGEWKIVHEHLSQTPV